MILYIPGSFSPGSSVQINKRKLGGTTLKKEAIKLIKKIKHNQDKRKAAKRL